MKSYPFLLILAVSTSWIPSARAEEFNTKAYGQACLAGAAAGAAAGVWVAKAADYPKGELSTGLKIAAVGHYTAVGCIAGLMAEEAHTWITEAPSETELNAEADAAE